MKAHLTPQEDATYSSAFEYYFNNVRRSNARADRHAWREVVLAHPRLARFNGCHARVKGAK